MSAQDTADQAKGEELLRLTRDFVARLQISCPETIYQTDRVIQEAYEFIEALVAVAGYHEEDEE